MTSCSICFTTKKNILSGCSLLPCSVVCWRQFLAPQTCCCHLTQITVDSNPCFAKCFQGGSWDRACYRLLSVSSCFLLPLYHCVGTEPRSGHFDILWPLGCAALCSHHTLATPVPVLSPAISTVPRAQPAPMLQEHCWGVASLQPCQGLAVILAHLVALLNPKPHTSMPAPHLKWCCELHLLVMLKVRSRVPPLPQVSLLHPCLAPATLPCHLPSYHTCFKSSSQPLSFTPTRSLCFQNSTRSELLSVPCLSYHLSQPGALCCTHTCSTPPASTADSMSPVCLFTNCPISWLLGGTKRTQHR